MLLKIARDNVNKILINLCIWSLKQSDAYPLLIYESKASKLSWMYNLIGMMDMGFLLYDSLIRPVLLYGALVQATIFAKNLLKGSRCFHD